MFLRVSSNLSSKELLLGLRFHVEILQNPGAMCAKNLKAKTLLKVFNAKNLCFVHVN